MRKVNHASRIDYKKALQDEEVSVAFELFECQYAVIYTNALLHLFTCARNCRNNSFKIFTVFTNF